MGNKKSVSLPPFNGAERKRVVKAMTQYMNNCDTGSHFLPQSQLFIQTIQWRCNRAVRLRIVPALSWICPSLHIPFLRNIEIDLGCSLKAFSTLKHQNSVLLAFAAKYVECNLLLHQLLCFFFSFFFNGFSLSRNCKAFSPTLNSAGCYLF